MEGHENTATGASAIGLSRQDAVPPPRLWAKDTLGAQLKASLATPDNSRVRLLVTARRAALRE